MCSCTFNKVIKRLQRSVCYSYGSSENLKEWERTVEREKREMCQPLAGHPQPVDGSVPGLPLVPAVLEPGKQTLGPVCSQAPWLSAPAAPALQPGSVVYYTHTHTHAHTHKHTHTHPTHTPQENRVWSSPVHCVEHFQETFLRLYSKPKLKNRSSTYDTIAWLQQCIWGKPLEKNFLSKTVIN